MVALRSRAEAGVCVSLWVGVSFLGAYDYERKKENKKERNKEREAVYCLFNLHCLNVAKNLESL